MDKEQAALTVNWELIAGCLLTVILTVLGTVNQGPSAPIS